VACCQGALVAACAPAPPAAPPAVPAPGAHELIVEGVRAERWIDGHPRLAAEARRGTLDRRAGQITAEDLVLVARDPSGAERGRLVARAAIADVRGQRAELDGQVTIVDPAGRTITATHATYLGATQIVEVPGPVAITGANFSARGPSMIVSLATETATVPGPVRGTVQPR